MPPPPTHSTKPQGSLKVGKLNIPLATIPLVHQAPLSKHTSKGITSELRNFLQRKCLLELTYMHLCSMSCTVVVSKSQDFGERDRDREGEKERLAWLSNN